MIKTEKSRVSNISMPFTDTELNARKSAKKFNVPASGEQEIEIENRGALLEEGNTGSPCKKSLYKMLKYSLQKIKN